MEEARIQVDEEPIIQAEEEARKKVDEHKKSEQEKKPPTRTLQPLKNQEYRREEREDKKESKISAIGILMMVIGICIGILSLIAGAYAFLVPATILFLSGGVINSNKIL